MMIAVVVGNPKAGSRTLGVAEAVAHCLIGIGDTPSDIRTIDLAAFASQLFDFESEHVNECLGAVANSELVIVASPTYKATYTGLLKAFLDRYQNDALRGTICIPVMTGAAPIHALAPEVHLRPLLVELGASVPTRGIYVTEQQLDGLEALIANWLSAAHPLLQAALSHQG